ncbi:phosphonate ABC transporter, permease protein PhnE (plasmid) [Martelella lutilitoris]|jgi:phosphonate transport system permease protein|uniref:Phosphonate ABC transporter, permease protein PhnE n=1 Tax=Martelella lutilitoris TaxID=2583532 RepID=A0A7T7HPZ0_9HYPH|nr:MULTISPECIES: phosphonate ABC transporter, permease protein PhnE [Martelella]AMM87378.1 membrane channel protein of Pn transporter [Martelella sp. AD-3]MAM12220.1 phosphonate ABC transporter, permease protein PhnE [Rhizobiaceae bacterium]QQM33057.1 phosphonate ABC transporter, permease protein PhnE [Martelella lutilitoris]QRX65208.1 phosphonate ABC transporter, permease protein PhnE [Dysgonomonadaceae bacterium zrk40]
MESRGWGGFATGGLVAGAVLWSLATTDVELSRLFSAGPRIGDFLARMFPPDPSVMTEIINGSAETLRIAILGTLGAVLLSGPLGVFASETMAPPVVHRPVRTALALIRAIPLILVAMLMVGAVGLGPLPGIIAVAIHATGMLAKFYAEAIDGVARGPIAALESAGAGPLARLRYAIWPQMAPVIARDTIFRFELNLRESLILGIVGAGGIGFYIQTYVRSFQYEKAASVTLAVIAMVLAIEAFNVALRRRFS